MRAIDPANPQLQSLHGPDWVPSEADLNTLRTTTRDAEERGLLPGDYWGNEFNYWPDEGCQATLDRIEPEWIAAGKDPNLGEPVCWFAPRPMK